MSGTTLKGTFTDCGPGNLPQLDFGCVGSSCFVLNEFPGGASVDNGNGLDYKSNARCDSKGSTYISQYVFTQPENQIDHPVAQEQNITLPECKGLHVQSDGTGAGTKVDGVTRTTGPDCEPPPPRASTVIIPQPQSSQAGIGASSAVTGQSSLAGGVPTSAAPPLASSSSINVGGIILSGIGGGASSTGGGSVPTKSSNPSQSPNPTQSQPAVFTGRAGCRQRPKTGVLIVFLLFVGFFIQGSAAYRLGPEMGPLTEKRTAYKLKLRALSDNTHLFAEQLGGYVAEQANSQGFADQLISDTISAICTTSFTGGATASFSPVVVDNCVTSVYDDSSSKKADVEFLSVFGASMFCNYITSQAYPIANQFSSEACTGLEDLVVGSSSSIVVPRPTSGVVSPPRSTAVVPSSTPAPPPSTPVPPPTSSQPSSRILPSSTPTPPPPSPPSSTPVPPPPSPPSSTPVISPPSPPSSTKVIPPPSPPSSTPVVPPTPPPSSTPVITPTPPPPSSTIPSVPPFRNSSIPSSTSTAPPICTATTQALCNGICKSLLDDPQNCGACGTVCPSGICSNGACSTNSCTGRTCNTFTSCGPGGDCVCYSTSDGTGFCAGNPLCAGLADCTGSSDCPVGSVCVVNSCCTRNVCIPADTCGGTTPPAALFIRGWEDGNDTSGYAAGWRL
ncbi:hypothetical protein BCR34DRAFT_239750 [Clohesyomyces aquaticus]|uniref:Uncharacterized protein n=1 Tax=Clohesyomyces aquaticus TaxID=1231657 RepID=A0A1Y1Y6Y4_9PLEO|nr:hypothetical protein BCR34DRAFT_239750 [Clohesyomyces aquaticus]